MTARPAILAGLLLLTGCATPTGSGRSLWLPSTWLGGDAAHRQGRAEERRDAASDSLTDAAHGYVVAAGAALAADPAPSQPSQAAARLVGEAREALDRARGLLAPDVLDARETLGRQLATAEGRELEAARRELDRVDDSTRRMAELLERRDREIAEAHAATAAESRARLADAALIARQRVMLWGGLGVIVALLIGFPALFLPLLSTARAAASAAGRGLAQTVAGIQRLKAERPDVKADVARVLPMAQDEDVRAEVARIKARLP